jgi:hypothetical protein
MEITVRWARLFRERNTTMHPSSDELEEYSLGKTTGTNAARELEEHLLICAVCRDKADELREYGWTIARAMRNLSEEPPREES